MHAGLTFIPKNLIFLLYIQLWLAHSGVMEVTVTQDSKINRILQKFKRIDLPMGPATVEVHVHSAIVQTTSLFSVPPGSATWTSLIRIHHFFIMVLNLNPTFFEIGHGNTLIM
jgi:hypothetical protein